MSSPLPLCSRSVIPPKYGALIAQVKAFRIAKVLGQPSPLDIRCRLAIPKTQQTHPKEIQYETAHHELP